MKPDFKIEWVDGHREPVCVPDLRFPNGIDVDCSRGQESCLATLPYPARRCGHFYIECKNCGTNCLITTAGRMDDPRTVKLPCQKKET